MNLEERVEKIEKQLNTVHYREPKVALLVSESTFHAIIDQVIELESGGLEITDTKRSAIHL
ncbi:MAG: hypothetical protein SPF57_08825 [Streptococcus orisratti]|uniref:hypothetical protein n=1 Tax=Streptococcus orisratti TaxID=114652 RepID=UPI002A91A7CD|nr:hypothetical protein [Streptococcus orisratti]MDY5636413.1 hypothetical protein [Streptococcus orisratti]